VTADVHGKAPEGQPDYVVAVSVDPQGSATWWAERVGDSLPFSFIQAHTKEQLEGLAELKKLKTVRHVFVDTPGWADISDEEKHLAGDALGESASADALRAVLAAADDIIVPIEPEPLGFIPTQTTIEEIIKPRRIPYLVVISNWDPRDGRADLDDTKAFVNSQGWPLANTVIRHYKVHARAAAEAQVVTQYPKNRVSMEAREDFFRLALELRAGGKGTR
jgi:chromosome partitioning protein